MSKTWTHTNTANYTYVYHFTMTTSMTHSYRISIHNILLASIQNSYTVTEESSFPSNGRYIYNHGIQHGTCQNSPVHMHDKSIQPSQQKPVYKPQYDTRNVQNAAKPCQKSAVNSEVKNLSANYMLLDRFVTLNFGKRPQQC